MRKIIAGIGVIGILVLLVFAERFGYETVGTAGVAPLGNSIKGSIYTLPVDGKVHNITASLAPGPFGFHDTKCAIYDSDLNLVASTDEIAYGSLVDGWNTFNFSSPPSLSAGDYWLVCWSDYYCVGMPWEYIDAELRYDNGPTNGALYQTETYNSFPNSLSPDGYVDFNCSIYASYTPLTPINISNCSVQLDQAGRTYQLTQDINATSISHGSCLNVTVDDVTLDGRNYTLFADSILSPGAPPDLGNFGVVPWTVASKTFTIKNIEIRGFYKAISTGTTETYAENIKINESTYALALQDSNITAVDSEIGNLTSGSVMTPCDQTTCEALGGYFCAPDFCYLSGKSHYYFLNSSFGDYSEVYPPARIHKQWYLDVTVYVNVSDPVEGANVTCKDIQDQEEFSALTNSSGKISTQGVTDYYIQSNCSGHTIHHKNNHTVTAVKYISSHKFSATKSINVSSNSVMNLTLEYTGPSISAPTIYPETIYTNNNTNASLTVVGENSTYLVEYNWTVNDTLKKAGNLSATNNTLLWIPELGSGNYSKGDVIKISARAFDIGWGKWNSTNRTVSNSPPREIEKLPNWSIYHDENVSIQWNVTDADGDLLTYACNDSIATINQSGYISGTFTPSDVGNYSLAVNATDGSATVTDSWTLEIKNLPPGAASSPLWSPNPPNSEGNSTPSAIISDPENVCYMNTTFFHYNGSSWIPVHSYDSQTSCTCDSRCYADVSLPENESILGRDDWKFQIVPYDGAIHGNPVNVTAIEFRAWITKNTEFPHAVQFNCTGDSSGCIIFNASGVVLDCNDSTIYSSDFVQAVGAKMNGFQNNALKNCHFGNYKWIVHLGYNQELINCTFQNIDFGSMDWYYGFYGLDNIGAGIQNCSFINITATEIPASEYGILITQGDGNSFKNIQFSNIQSGNPKGVGIQLRHTGSSEIIDSSLTGSGTSLELSSSGSTLALNVSMGSVSFADSHSLTRKWYLDSTVKNSSGDPADQGNLSLWQNSGGPLGNTQSNLIFSLLTNSSGKVPKRNLTQYIQTSSDITYSSPYYLKAWKDSDWNSSNSTLTSNWYPILSLGYAPTVNISWLFPPYVMRFGIFKIHLEATTIGPVKNLSATFTRDAWSFLEETPFNQTNQGILYPDQSSNFTWYVVAPWALGFYQINATLNAEVEEPPAIQKIKTIRG